jgi:hypothetical protein
LQISCGPICAHFSRANHTTAAGVPEDFPRRILIVSFRSQSEPAVFDSSDT